jgi:hypothetical protein
MGANPNSSPAGAFSERLGDLQRETGALIESLERATSEIGDALRAEMEERPYVAMAVAAGVGYVLGGGLPSPLTRMIVLLGGRVGFEMLSREVTTHLANGMSAATDGGGVHAERTEES